MSKYSVLVEIAIAADVEIHIEAPNEEAAAMLGSDIADSAAPLRVLADVFARYSGTWLDGDLSREVFVRDRSAVVT